MKLSERLEARLALRAAPTEIAKEPAYVDSADCRALLQEAAELARRVEDAPCAVAGQSPGRFYYVGGSAPVEHGQRVRLVPEAGQGGGNNG